MIDQVAARLAAARLELEAAGATPDQAGLAIKRAVGLARMRATWLSPAIRQQGFDDLLEHELRYAPSWIEGSKRAARDGSYATEMKRVVRDDRVAEGLRKGGTEMGPKYRKAWREGVEQRAGERWQKRFS